MQTMYKKKQLFACLDNNKKGFVITIDYTNKLWMVNDQLTIGNSNKNRQMSNDLIFLNKHGNENSV